MLEEHVRAILLELGYDPDSNPSLKDTPRRVADMLRELTAKDPDDDRLVLFDVEGYNDITVERDIPYFTLCEHHLLPFYGTVTVAYLTKGRIFGVSKLARIVRKNSRGLNTQEVMTHRIADDVYRALGNDEDSGVMVISTGVHMCQVMRGVKTSGQVVTSAIRGKMMDPRVKSEVLSLVNLNDGSRHT